MLTTVRPTRPLPLPLPLLLQSLFIFVLTALPEPSAGCQFHPAGEYLKFVRVPETLRLGSEILAIEVHPRTHLTIIPVDKEEDSRFFAYREANATHISVVLAQSLEDLVDASAPRNLLKFRLACDYADPGSNSLSSSHLSVTVYVEDVNDHAPQFLDAPYRLTVDESTAKGSTVFRGIHAFDRDKPNTPNSDIRYAIARGNDAGKFSLEPGHKQAALVLRKELDYDAGDRRYDLLLTATDRGMPPKSTNTSITITVVDNDDLEPKFTQDLYRTQIFEFYPMPVKPIHKEIEFPTPIRAVDQDQDIDVPVRYEIVSGNERHLFHIDPKNGSLFLEKPIDLDVEKSLPNNTFKLQIRAYQADDPAKFTEARVEVEVLDLNDNLPEFEVDFYNISIVENLPNGFSVLQVIATDRDQGANSEFRYELRDPSHAFAIDALSGWLTVQDQTVLDREKDPQLRMRVLAVEQRPSVVGQLVSPNGSSAPFPASAVDVQVTLLDANDNNPVFPEGNLLQLSIPADSPVGSVVGQVRAQDRDLGGNGRVRYRLQQPGNSSDLGAQAVLQVEPETGLISVRESPVPWGRHVLFVEAYDQPANPSERRFSLAVVSVDAIRSNGQESWTPEFLGAPYEFWVGSNVPIGTSVGQIRVNDAARNKDVLYDLLHSYPDGVPFAVEEHSGTISVVDAIHKYKPRPEYEFEAVVSNEKDVNLVTNVSIHVVDPNDDSGLITKGTTKAPLVFHIRENLPGAPIGGVVPGNLSNAVKDIRFLIANQQDVAGLIAINERGDLYTIGGLDREAKRNHSLTVIAESPRGLGIFQVIIVVDDEDDNVPIFSSTVYEGHVLENSSPGTEVSLKTPISAHDPDDKAIVLFRLEGEGSHLFRIEPNTARVFFAPNSSGMVLDREEKSSYNLKIVAGESLKCKKCSEAALKIFIGDVNDNPPTFAQMIILPDQGIKVGKPEQEDSQGKSAIGNVRSPLLFVPENVTIGVPVIRLVARDPDSGSNAEITYSIQSESGALKSPEGLLSVKRYFLMDSRSGEISAVGVLPPERDLVLEILASDSGGLSDNMTVQIRVIDVNDHAPQFRQSWYSFDVAEGNYRRFEIGRVEAGDADFGENANVTYEIEPAEVLVRPEGSTKAKFEIGKWSGVIMVTGVLDRETRDSYEFRIRAKDGGVVPTTSSANMEIRVQDVNDNPPKFYGYQEVGKLPTPPADIPRKDSQQLVPVFYASVPENCPVSTIVTKIFANDSDFAGNGNGLILFDSPHEKGQQQYFTIDSKEGLVTTIGQLDYESRSLHNLTIVASDLGSPSLSSTALLMVRILNVDEGPEEIQRPVFQHQYYEVEVEENTEVPLSLVTLDVAKENSGPDNESIRYSLVMLENDIDAQDRFSIDPKTGEIEMLISPDREVRDSYELRVRVDKAKVSRGMPVTVVYPVTDGERLNGLAVNEARVIIKIKDVNDNSPKFKNSGRPVVAAIPSFTHYGYNIVQLEAEDPDEGLNGQIRYQILGQENLEKFSIDSLTGHVRSAGSFAKDNGKVFGFDVKATDRDGADDGRSAITNVFIYVIDDNKQVVISLGKRPMEIESEMKNISSTLQNITGFDVRIRKVEARSPKNLADDMLSDLFLYAVDPNLNTMIDTDEFHKVLRSKKHDIMRELEKYRVVEIGQRTRAHQHRANQSPYLLSTFEIAIVCLGVAIFLGAFVTAICVSCAKRNHSRDGLDPDIFQSRSPIGLALADSSGSSHPHHPKLSGLFPAYLGTLHYDPASPYAAEMTQKSFCEHEANCLHYHQSNNYSASGAPTGPSQCTTRPEDVRGKKGARRSKAGSGINGLENSATSLHSSGQDSGIVAGLRPCQCSNSSSPSSAESSNGYEDSLKSIRHSHQYGQTQYKRSKPKQTRGSRAELDSDLPDGPGQRWKRESSGPGNQKGQGSSQNARNARLSQNQRFHSFTNLDAIQQPDSQYLGRRYQTLLGDQKAQVGSNFPAHRRTYSESENNTSESFVRGYPHHHQPRSTITVNGVRPSSRPHNNQSFLHGKAKSMLVQDHHHYYHHQSGPATRLAGMNHQRLGNGSALMTRHGTDTGDGLGFSRPKRGTE